MSRPSLSVVIPTHDTRELTLACLASLPAGGAEPLEIIVVDDASSDGTAAAVQDLHPDAAVVATSRNVGFSRAANLGAERAAGEVVLLLNSDTEVLEGALAAALAAFADDPHLGIAGAELFDPSGRAQWRAGRRPTPAWLFLLTSGLGGALALLPGRGRLGAGGAARSGRVDWVTGAAMAIRREAWQRCGPFDESYRFYAQDLDLCTAASAAGWTVAVAPGFRVLHHHGATIAARPGTAGAVHPELLWSDLLHFVAKHRGEAAARRARRLMRFGARLRLATRRAAAPFVGATARDAWRRDTEAYRAALDALRKR